MKNIKKTYWAGLGIFFAVSIMMALAGITGVIASAVYLVFALMVLLGCMESAAVVILGMFAGGADYFPLILFSLAIIMIVAWIACVGIIDLLAVLFLWNVSNLAMVSFEVILLAGFMAWELLV